MSGVTSDNKGRGHTYILASESGTANALWAYPEMPPHRSLYRHTGQQNRWLAQELMGSDAYNRRREV